MNVQTYIYLSREEIQSKIAYSLICETMGGSRWETGKRKRLFVAEFTETERNVCRVLYKQAYDWYLRKGVPEQVKMTPKTLFLWEKLANFCSTL